MHQPLHNPEKHFFKYGLYDEKYTLLEDYPRWIKLTEKGVNIVFWDHIVVKYRKGGVSSKPNIILQKDRVIFRKNIVQLENKYIYKMTQLLLLTLQKMKLILYQIEFSQKIRKPLDKIIDICSKVITEIIVRTNYIVKK